MLARRKDKLELVNRRLNEFYGPLYIALQAAISPTARCSKSRVRSRAFPFSTAR